MVRMTEVGIERKYTVCAYDEDLMEVGRKKVDKLTEVRELKGELEDEGFSVIVFEADILTHKKTEREKTPKISDARGSMERVEREEKKGIERERWTLIAYGRERKEVKRLEGLSEAEALRKQVMLLNSGLEVDLFAAEVLVPKQMCEAWKVSRTPNYGYIGKAASIVKWGTKGEEKIHLCQYHASGMHGIATGSIVEDKTRDYAPDYLCLRYCPSCMKVGKVRRGIRRVDLYRCMYPVGDPSWRTDLTPAFRKKLEKGWEKDVYYEDGTEGGVHYFALCRQDPWWRWMVEKRKKWERGELGDAGV